MTLQQLTEKLIQDRGKNVDTFVFYVKCLYRERTSENLDLIHMCYEKLLGILEGFHLLGYITYLEYVGLVDNLTELYIGNS